MSKNSLGSQPMISFRTQKKVFMPKTSQNNIHPKSTSRHVKRKNLDPGPRVIIFSQLSASLSLKIPLSVIRSEPSAPMGTLSASSISYAVKDGMVERDVANLFRIGSKLEKYPTVWDLFLMLQPWLWKLNMDQDEAIDLRSLIFKQNSVLQSLAVLEKHW